MFFLPCQKKGHRVTKKKKARCAYYINIIKGFFVNDFNGLQGRFFRYIGTQKLKC